MFDGCEEWPNGEARTLGCKPSRAGSLQWMAAYGRSALIRIHPKPEGKLRMGSRSKPWLLGEQGPYPQRQSGMPFWLYPHRRTGLGLQSIRRFERIACAQPQSHAGRPEAMTKTIFDRIYWRVAPVVYSVMQELKGLAESGLATLQGPPLHWALVFNRVKQIRRMATRDDKTVLSFMGFLNLASSGLSISSHIHTCYFW